MLIVCDVGNTEITIGVFAHIGSSAVGKRGRISTHAATVPHAPRDSASLALELRSLLKVWGLRSELFTGAAIASVVAPITEPLATAIGQIFPLVPVVLTTTTAMPISVHVDEPLRVGIDRIINAFAALELYGVDAICIDFGTATTFDCVTADRVFHGGVIMPGVRTSAASLVKHAPRLADIDLQVPARVIGTNTDACIRAGVLYGAADAADGIAARIKSEWPGSQMPIVIATGGLSHVMRSICRSFDRVEPDLTLHGIRLAFALADRPGN